MNNIIGMKVKVYDRYLFAIPVIGKVLEISHKDGALRVNFDGMNNPGGHNVTKHSGKYFHHQQCRLLVEKGQE